jgi:hypothetical protein
MRVNLKSCQFFADSIQYCGYIIDENGIHKMQEKTEAISDMQTPKNKDEVRAFIGLVNYYRRFPIWARLNIL